MPTNPTIGGGTNARPLRDTLAQTGRGLPDDAVSPEQRTLPDGPDLAERRAAERIAQKLQQEAERFLRSGARAGADGAD